MNRAELAPALRSRNFRIFWLSQIVSTIGTSLQVIAEGYLIFKLTDSTFWLGAVGFISLLPVVPISLAGGVLIDRVPRRKLILATQIGLMLQALVFGLLAVSGRIELWHVLVLYFVFGALLAIDHPARRAFLVDLVERDDLANAVALNATLFNIANLVGFALGGFLIAAVGVGGTMLINAITYLFPITAMLLINVPDIAQDETQNSFAIALSEGFITLWQRPALLAMILVTAVVGGLAYPVFGLMPAYAERIMGVDAIGLGILLASGALGSILGTIGAARLGVQHRGRNLLLSALILPFLVIGFAFAPNMIVACTLLVAIGFALLILQSLAITIVQLNTPDRVRGRVMTIYSMLHAGSDTGGNMIIGTIAVPLGLSIALALGGAIGFLAASGTNLFMPAVRDLE
jgi:MFS family permease